MEHIGLTYGTWPAAVTLPIIAVLLCFLRRPKYVPPGTVNNHWAKTRSTFFIAQTVMFCLISFAVSLRICFNIPCIVVLEVSGFHTGSILTKRCTAHGRRGLFVQLDNQVGSDIIT